MRICRAHAQAHARRVRAAGPASAPAPAPALLREREVFVCLSHAYHGATDSVIEISPYKYASRGGRGRAPYVIEVGLPESFDDAAIEKELLQLQRSIDGQMRAAGQPRKLGRVEAPPALRGAVRCGAVRCRKLRTGLTSRGWALAVRSLFPPRQRRWRPDAGSVASLQRACWSAPTALSLAHAEGRRRRAAAPASARAHVCALCVGVRAAGCSRARARCGCRPASCSASTPSSDGRAGCALRMRCRSVHTHVATALSARAAARQLAELDVQSPSHPHDFYLTFFFRSSFIRVCARADWFWSYGRQVLGVRVSKPGAGHGVAGEEHRQRAPHGGAGVRRRRRRCVRQRLGVLQQLRRHQHRRGGRHGCARLHRTTGEERRPGAHAQRARDRPGTLAEADRVGAIAHCVGRFFRHTRSLCAPDCST